MGLIHFDAEAYPLEQRSAAWREALRSCGIASTLPSATPRGDFLALTSRQGCRFVQINAGPQDLTWEEANRDLWLCFLLEGSGLLPDGTPLRPQNLCIGTMAKPGGVTLTEPFRLLLIVLPAIMIFEGISARKAAARAAEDDEDALFAPTFPVPPMDLVVPASRPPQRIAASVGAPIGLTKADAPTTEGDDR